MLNIACILLTYLFVNFQIQGAIIVASLFQIVLGFSGVFGFALRFIGPLAIAPTITLVGLALFDVAAKRAAQQWWITLV